MTRPTELPFTFGVNQYTTTPWSFEQDVEHYTGAGVTVIEVCQDKLDRNPQRAAAQLDQAVGAGLRISSVQASVRAMVPSAGQPQPTDRQQRLDAFRGCVELVAPYAPEAVFVTNTGPAPQGNMSDAIRQTVTDHQELAGVAAEHGVRIGLEPLNPVSLNQETAIWTLQQALDVIAEVDRDNVGICFDTWNLWQNPNLPEAIAAAGEQLFLLQVSDWRTPRSGADRRNVGTGEIPTGRLLHAVYDAGYRGACVVEILSHGVPDSVYDTDLDEVLRLNRAAVEQAWQAG
ncbi:sugar phosphate isomerase/epimerase family protein [Kocuria marina]|uniref:sugar phosphate isomerase/epimerase family protein n=1 Tax=Kocuria marina TaxID=223184 RepID=UPI00119D4337|nr:sugar phosphate isomerase/epimerase family protein [Kocuria indica]